MLLTGLLPDISTDPAIETATDSIEAGRSGVIVAPVGVRPPLLAAVSSRAATPLVVLTATGRDDRAGTTGFDGVDGRLDRGIGGDVREESGE